jgi:hypothetical protein
LYKKSFYSFIAVDTSLRIDAAVAMLEVRL